MRMIENARFIWRRWSTRIAAIQVSSAIVWWVGLPTEWKAAIPETWIRGIVIVYGLSFVGAQLIAQPKLQQHIQDVKGDQNGQSDKC